MKKDKLTLIRVTKTVFYGTIVLFLSVTFLGLII